VCLLLKNLPNKLSLVPTPIGNLGDITLRALDTLKVAKVIAAEDTRHSRKLLNHFQIDKRLVRLDAHTINERAPQLLDECEHLAFITDAGTPGISDPGAELVRLALDKDLEIEVLPGATAFVPAVILSGLATNRFAFEGFLPRKGKERKERLSYIAKSPMTSIFYESPHRIVKTLEDLAKLCTADRQVSVSRELTKRFETTYRGTLADLQTELAGKDLKGEVVIVVSPQEEQAGNDFVAEAALLREEGLNGKSLQKALVAMGASRNLAYELSLKSKD